MEYEIMADPRCSGCGEAVPYWQISCRQCGISVGFPNQRAAEAERESLRERESLGRRHAETQGCGALIAEIEACAACACPVINMPPVACDDLLRDGKYRTYHQRVDRHDRDPAAAQNEADRTMVGARLFPSYYQHIVYAALSPDGKGLSNYGAVAVSWQVTSAYLGPRLSLLEENSFDFYDHHNLGKRGATIPAGYRAIWADREKLAVAKIAKDLTPAITPDMIPALFLHSGATRADDIFIEVHIYAEQGLETRDIVEASLQRPTADEDEFYRWKLIQNMCHRRNISIVD